MVVTEQIEGKIEHVSEKAYLVVPTIGPKQIWIPKSQVIDRTDADADGNVIFDVSDWWYNGPYTKALEGG